MFFNGLRVATRSDPSSHNWEPVVPGFHIADDGTEITVETPGMRYDFGHMVLHDDRTDEPERYADTGEAVRPTMPKVRPSSNR